MIELPDNWEKYAIYDDGLIGIRDDFPHAVKKVWKQMENARKEMHKI